MFTRVGGLMFRVGGIKDLSIERERKKRGREGKGIRSRSACQGASKSGVYSRSCWIMVFEQTLDPLNSQGEKKKKDARWP